MNHRRMTFTEIKEDMLDSVQRTFVMNKKTKLSLVALLPEAEQQMVIHDLLVELLSTHHVCTDSCNDNTPKLTAQQRAVSAGFTASLLCKFSD